MCARQELAIDLAARYCRIECRRPGPCCAERGKSMGIKDALFCSTALLTVAAVNDARATDGVKLGIGGYYHAAAGGVIGEDFSRSSGVSEGDVRDYVFKQKVDLTFNGETTLDNGLTVG